MQYLCFCLRNHIVYTYTTIYLRFSFENDCHTGRIYISDRFFNKCTPSVCGVHKECIDMIDARMKLKPYTNRVLSVVKAKYDLKDKSDALNRFAEMYGPEEVELEAKDSYVKKILALVDEHHKKPGKRYSSIAELRKEIEGD